VCLVGSFRGIEGVDSRSVEEKKLGQQRGVSGDSANSGGVRNSKTGADLFRRQFARCPGACSVKADDRSGARAVGVR
jgi:hypothetical protein